MPGTKYLLIIYFFLPVILTGQDGNAGLIVTTFKGFEIGYAYPWLSKPYDYSLQEADMSFGIKAGVQAGKFFKSQNAIWFSPTLTFGSFGKTTHAYERRDVEDNSLLYRRATVIKYRQLNILFPGAVETLLYKKLRFAVGGYIALSLAGSGHSWIMEEKKHHHFDFLVEKAYDFDTKSGIRPFVGAFTKLMVPLNINDAKKHFISLEYQHDLVKSYQGNGFERWLTIAYVQRNFVTKEKREKWDRYLIRRQ